MPRISPVWNYSSEEFINIVKSCRSLNEVVRKITGTNTNGGNPWQAVKRRVQLERLNHLFAGSRKRGNDVLDKSSSMISESKTDRQSIRKHIVRNKLIPYCCAVCSSLPIWNNKELVLHIDHINGLNNDHRIENLRFLCPNCHSQTSTYAGRNNKRKKGRGSNP